MRQDEIIKQVSQINDQDRVTLTVRIGLVMV